MTGERWGGDWQVSGDGAPKAALHRANELRRQRALLQTLRQTLPYLKLSVLPSIRDDPNALRLGLAARYTIRVKLRQFRFNP